MYVFAGRCALTGTYASRNILLIIEGDPLKTRISPTPIKSYYAMGMPENVTN
jgi:hypothetical protein